MTVSSCIKYSKPVYCKRICTKMEKNKIFFTLMWIFYICFPFLSFSELLFVRIPWGVVWCFVHVFFVQVTILNIVWGSRRTDTPWCAHFSIDICCVIQEGVITVGKCTHQGTPGHHSFCLDKRNVKQTSMHIPVIKISSQKYNKPIIGWSLV